MGRAPNTGELIATLYDEEGLPVDAISLWNNLCKEAPSGLDLSAFGMALEACVEAAQNDDLAGVLVLENAFAGLLASVGSTLGACEAPHRKGH